MTHLQPPHARLIVASVCLLIGSAGAAAAQSTDGSIGRGAVTVTAASHGDDAILAAESGSVRLEHRASRGGAGRIVLAAGRDRLEISITFDSLRIDAGGVVWHVGAESVATDLKGVRDVLRDHPAVAALAGLQAAFDDRTPAPLASAAAFVRMLAGDAGAMRRAARAASGTSPTGILFARQDAAACWSSYQNSVWIFFIDLESCLTTHSWNLPLQYACSFTYLVQSEMAWFNLIACSGGLPGA